MLFNVIEDIFHFLLKSEGILYFLKAKTFTFKISAWSSESWTHIEEWSSHRTGGDP